MQDIVVIGGGASGMAAAVSAARAGASVTVIYRKRTLQLNEPAHSERRL